MSFKVFASEYLEHFEDLLPWYYIACIVMYLADLNIQAFFVHVNYL